MAARIYTHPWEEQGRRAERSPASQASPTGPAPSNVVSLAARQQERRLEQAIHSLVERISTTEVPPPSHFGWTPVDQVDGRTTQWKHVRYQALIGYVAGSPELVFLDRGQHRSTWSMTLEELAMGLEVGTLPAPLFEEELP